METENRKFTLLSFFIFSSLCGYVLYLIFSAVADWLKFGGSNVIGGLSWPVVGGLAAGVCGVALFLALAMNSKALAFIDDVFLEMRKTTWPNSQETLSSTLVVSVLVTIAAVILFVIDYIWSILFKLILD